MSKAELYIGVMSGTSLDGVDVVLTRIDQAGITLLHHYCHPMPAPLKQRVLQINQQVPLPLAQIGQLDHQLGQLFADAILHFLHQYHIAPDTVTAIGNHGQTVYHQPEGPDPFTIQLGDANLIAVNTGITTIADFRRKDMALGGQGAPLVPAFHRAIFQSSDSTLVVLNIGGIANLSVMQPGQPVYGYDTGPGNGLLDGWCQHILQQPFDRDGQFAAQGNCHPRLLAQMKSDRYFQQRPPKSTGREHFNQQWLTNQLGRLNETVSNADVQATLMAFTIETIAREVTRYKTGPQPTLLVCGGGAKNPRMMASLSQQLPDWQVTDTDSRGISSDYLEAMAFAWLAYCRMHNVPSNLPEVTGASRATPLGVIYHAD